MFLNNELNNTIHSKDVAEHSFQVPIPNSPLSFLNDLCLGACLSQEVRLTAEGFIVAFWLGCVLLPWQRGWLKNVFCLFKKFSRFVFVIRRQSFSLHARYY